jgi:hypothetical protein
MIMIFPSTFFSATNFQQMLVGCFTGYRRVPDIQIRDIMFEQTERNYVKKEVVQDSVGPCTKNTNQSEDTELPNYGITVSKRCVLSAGTVDKCCDWKQCVYLRYQRHTNTSKALCYHLIYSYICSSLQLNFLQPLSCYGQRTMLLCV